MISQAPEQVVSPSPALQVSKRISVTYLIGSLRDAGTERQALELMTRLDPRRFAVSAILMEPTGSHRLCGHLDRYAVLQTPQAGAAHWVRRGPALLSLVNSVRKYLKAWQTDILHAFLPGPSILGAMAAHLARVPVVIGSRRSLPDFYRQGRGFTARLADTVGFHLADLNLGNSMAVSSAMIAAGCPTAKCSTIFNGVDTVRFHPGLWAGWRREIGCREDDILLGMVANFRACKRHCDFVAAAAILAERYPQLKFVMVGADAGARNEVEQQISALQLKSKVFLFDTDPRPETIFAGIDIYVCASDTEGFSNVLLEALACGKPVIATNVGGNPEIITHGENGFLVPARSPASLATAAEVLICDPNLRKAMGARGRKLVEQKFSLAGMVSRHEDLYTSLISEHSH